MVLSIWLPVHVRKSGWKDLIAVGWSTPCSCLSNPLATPAAIYKALQLHKSQEMLALAKRAAPNLLQSIDHQASRQMDVA